MAGHGLDLSGFINQPTEAGKDLNELAATMRQKALRDREFTLQQEGKRAATSKFLTDYLDPKDHLTGSPYDPQIVSGLQDLLQQGQMLASKGADTNSILMALGPQVAKLTDYQTKAKMINDQIKASSERLKAYPGYNLEALQDQAKRAAFYGPDGKLKDISQVDPNINWISEAVKNNPELVTSSKGLDDFVQKTPMADYSRNVQTVYAGKTRNVKYEAKHPFWEDLKRDANGNVITDAMGQPVGLSVVGSNILDDKGNPIINPETNQPYAGLNKNYFNAIMSHNPDVADYIRGQVNVHFKQAGAQQPPAEGSPQWNAMAQHILQDELQSRSRSYFRTIDQQKENQLATKVEIARDPEELALLKNFYDQTHPQKTPKEPKTNAVQTIGEIFNNNPDFLQGQQEDVNGRSVLNVTQYMPGGGLKTGRGSGETYQQIWYDPAKRSLLVSTQPKVKDESGNKPVSIEEIPENKIGFFMSRIAASNGVDPKTVPSIMDQLGYKNAKFGNPSAIGGVGDRMNTEHLQHISDAVQNEDFGKLSGIPTKDGVISEVVKRSGWQLGMDRYAVYVKGADGKAKKAFTTDDKDELDKYLKSGNSQIQTGESKIQWK